MTPPQPKRQKLTPPLDLGRRGEITTLAALQKMMCKLTANTIDLDSDEVKERAKLLKELQHRERSEAGTAPYPDFSWANPLLENRIHPDIVKTLIVNGGRASVAALNHHNENIAHLVPVYLTSPDQIHEIFELLDELGYEDLFNGKDERGTTPLQVGLMYRQLKEDTIRLVLDSGTSLNERDNTGNNALYYLIQGQYAKAQLTLLVELGADWRNINNLGRNLAHEAIHFGNVEALRLFSNLGLRIEAEDFTRLNIDKEPTVDRFIKLLSTWWMEVVPYLKFLLDFCGPAVFMKEPRVRELIVNGVYNTSCKTEAEIQGRVEILRVMQDGDDTVMGSIISHFVHYAYFHEYSTVHLSLLKFLFKDGFRFLDLRKITTGGWNIFHCVASCLRDADEFHEIAEFLVENGLKDLLTSRTSGSRSALHITMSRMELRRKTLDLFMAAGIDFAEEGRNNMLIKSVENGASKPYLEMLLNLCDTSSFGGWREILARRGGSAGVTVLHAAVATSREDKDQLELVNLLLHEYQMSEDLKQPRMRNLVAHSCTNTAPSFGSGVVPDPEKRIEVIRALLKADKTLLEGVSREDEKTPILMPHVHFKILKFLVRSGANLYAVDERTGFNLLHTFYSDQCRTEDIGKSFRILVEAVAARGRFDVLRHVTCKSGENALLLAMRLGPMGVEEKVIRIFAQHGVDLNTSDSKGNNLLRVAAERNGATKEYMRMLERLIDEYE